MTFSVARVLLSTQGICYCIGFSRMVTNFTFVIIQQFYPSSLSHVEIFLVEDVLQTLIVCEDCAFGSILVVSPYFQGKHHCSQFEIVCVVIDLMVLELYCVIGDDLSSLHE